jgi:hypothetical protein
MTHLDSQIKPFSQSQEIHDQTNIPPNELFPPAGIVCRRHALLKARVGALRPKPEGGVGWSTIMNLDRLFFAYRSLIRSWIPILPVSKTNTKTNTPQRIVLSSSSHITGIPRMDTRQPWVTTSWLLGSEQVRQNHSVAGRWPARISSAYAVFSIIRHSTFTEFERL